MNYKNVFRFYLQICNHTLKMLPNMLLIKRLARLQMLGFICHHLPPSATACDIVFLWVADKLLVAILHWERGRLVPDIWVAYKQLSATLSSGTRSPLSQYKVADESLSATLSATI